MGRLPLMPYLGKILAGWQRAHPYLDCIWRWHNNHIELGFVCDEDRYFPPKVIRSAHNLTLSLSLSPTDVIAVLY
jgi:hypothetical protein